MDKGELDKLVSKTIKAHLVSVGACFGEKSGFEESLFKSYQGQRLHEQFNSFSNRDESIGSYSKFKIKKCFPKYEPEIMVHQLISALFLSEEERIDVDAVDFDRNLFEAEEKLELFFRSLRRVRKLLINDNFLQAEKLFDQLKAGSKASITCREVGDTFLVAGSKGLLHPYKGYTGEPWTEKLNSEYERTISLFSSFLGDININEITSLDLDSFFTDIISNLPKVNYSPYNKMTFDQLVEAIESGSIDDSEILSNKTINHHLKKIKTMFKYYEVCMNGSSKVIDNMRFNNKGKDNKRGAFSKARVTKILAYVDKLNNGKKWPVNIMAFTGMRNSEVMQLRKEDIKISEEGIHYFHISHDAGKLKTEQSDRRVPIHDILIQKGFLDFVDQSKDKYLFKKYSTSGKYLSRLFANSIRPECNIPTTNDMGEKLSLYSLRHFVITSMIEEGVSLFHVQKIVGHMVSQEKSVTVTNYAHLDSMKKLHESINVIRLN